MNQKIPILCDVRRDLFLSPHWDATRGRWTACVGCNKTQRVFFEAFLDQPGHVVSHERVDELLDELGLSPEAFSKMLRRSRLALRGLGWPSDIIQYREGDGWCINYNAYQDALRSMQEAQPQAA